MVINVQQCITMRVLIYFFPHFYLILLKTSYGYVFIMLQNREMNGELFHSRSILFATAVVRGIAVKGDQSLECMDQNKCNYVKNMVFPN